MSVLQISDLAVQAIYNRLSHPTTGFNATFVENATAHGIPADYISIDFDPQTTKNFAFAYLEPDAIEQSMTASFPFATLYCMESDNLRGDPQKFSSFSGIVRIVFEVFLSWKPILGKAVRFDRYGSCVESAVVDVINRVENQNWGHPLAYNGNIQCRRGPLQFAAENWRQRISFSIIVGVHK
jgi:hypothetical protein